MRHGQLDAVEAGLDEVGGHLGVGGNDLGDLLDASSDAAAVLSSSRGSARRPMPACARSCRQYGGRGG